MLKFSELYGLNKGQTALVIGNGPSLKPMMNKVLRSKYPTMGSNRVYLLGGGFAPTYYACVNQVVLDQNGYEIKKLAGRSLMFLPAAYAQDYAAHSLRPNPAPMFSFDPSSYIYEGYTVTFVLLQLAFFLGFTTVLLVGVDHRYDYTGEPNALNLMDGPDPNHFDPEYFQNQVWNNPDLERSEEAYVMAREAFEADNRRIINLTPGSALTVFDHGSPRKWL